MITRPDTLLRVQGLRAVLARQMCDAVTWDRRVDMAAALGTSQAHLDAILNGEANFSLVLADRMARELDRRWLVWLRPR